ncbi:MAG: hypothetical protein MZV64_73615 [Ignavibacteriales bacterium]|nr:hypothetical protein [Ignavibacteriales bacterium]
MVDGREPLGGTAADALGRGIRGDEVGMTGFELPEARHQPVELGVGDAPGRPARSSGARDRG